MTDPPPQARRPEPIGRPGPVPAAVRPHDVRQWLGQHRPSATSPRTVLFGIYLAALFGGVPVVLAVLGADHALPAVPPAAAAVLNERAGAVAAAVMAMWAGLRLRRDAWRGAALVAPPDVHHLLTAPLGRRGLLGSRALIVAGRASGEGAVVVLAIWLASTGVLGMAPDIGRLLAGLVTGACAGAITGGAGLLAVGSQQGARILLRGGLALIAAGAGVVWWGDLPAVEGAARWSGPWGWAGAAVVPGGPGPSTAVAVCLAAVGAGIMLVLMWWALDHLHAELLAGRATRAARTAALVFFGDVAELARQRRDALGTLLGWPRWSLPRPRRPQLVVPWAAATLMIRARWLPGRLVAAVLSATAAGVWAGAAQAVAVIAVLLTGHLAASGLVAAASTEHHQRLLAVHLAQAPHRSTLQLVGTGATVLGALGLVAAVLAWAAGGSVHPGLGVALSAPTLCAATAWAVLRDPPDPARQVPDVTVLSGLALRGVAPSLLGASALLATVTIGAGAGWGAVVSQLVVGAVLGATAWLGLWRWLARREVLAARGDDAADDTATVQAGGARADDAADDPAPDGAEESTGGTGADHVGP